MRDRFYKENARQLIQFPFRSIIIADPGMKIIFGVDTNELMRRELPDHPEPEVGLEEE